MISATYQIFVDLHIAYSSSTFSTYLISQISLPVEHAFALVELFCLGSVSSLAREGVLSACSCMMIAAAAADVIKTST